MVSRNTGIFGLDDQEVASMRRIWGGLLVFVTGVVIAVTGVGSSDGVTVGALPCGVAVGVPVACPTGTITVTSVTQGAGQRPAAWSVTIGSTNCTVLDDTFDVTDGGQAVSPPLFAFTTSQQDTPCRYSLTETPVAGFTPAFDPAAPYVLPTGRNATLAVTLTNTGAAATTAPPTTTAPASSASVAPTSVTARPTATRPTLANTGPASTVRWTLWVGLATCALGIALVAVGWRSRSPQHQPPQH